MYLCYLITQECQNGKGFFYGLKTMTKNMSRHNLKMIFVISNTNIEPDVVISITIEDKYCVISMIVCLSEPTSQGNFTANRMKL